ncbi:SAV_2336 N-terminal domain-related protein [Kitasatospora sp. NPDC048286]|uniref:SAV_2336 N-terminal domain-related protein n=1 Tax=Kitasatospora sp. NPDC048286 TaxID=3364047 RepID=UPI00371EDA68
MSDLSAPVSSPAAEAQWEPTATPLERIVAALHATAPGLDATALSEAIWLASRLGSAAPLSPGGDGDLAEPADESTAEAPDTVAPQTTPPTAPPTVPRGRTPVPAFHERLPGSDSLVRGDASSIPRAGALPLALEVSRALRPWKRPWRAGRRRTLDVGATVDGYARSGDLLPVFGAAPERWFDLVLVVDRSPSMQVWTETVDAFAGTLDRLGAFRTLQVRDLTFDADSSPQLRDSQGRSSTVGQLRSPNGRRLVLTVSDCATDAWRAPAVWQQLRTWARTTPVALLNPLPTKLWRRSGLDLPTVRATPDRPGASSPRLSFTLPLLLPEPTGDGTDRSWLPLPVVSLSPRHLDRWSRAVMTAAPEGCAAVLVPPGGRLPTRPGQPHPTRSRGPAELADGFLRTAAPAAARLAVLCSQFDRLSLGLLHTIRRELLPRATTADLAEVLTSGVFTLETDPGGAVQVVVPPQAQTRLRQELTEHEVWRLNRALSRSVSSQGAGRGRLPAVVRHPEGQQEFPAASVPFGQALERTRELLGLPAASETGTAVPSGDQIAEDLTSFATRLALALLPTDVPPTQAELTDSAHLVTELLERYSGHLDREALLRRLETLVAVFQPAPVASDTTVHLPWLDRRTGDRSQDFWERHLRYLREIRAVQEDWARYLDESTDEVLGRLEDPHRAGGWRRTGLVLTQGPGSGRTGHGIALAAKAIDAGYRVIVFLTGNRNNLRIQTQQHVDEGLLGFDTGFRRRTDRHDGALRHLTGAGALPNAKQLSIISLTGADRNGDFTPARAAQIAPLGSTIPLVFVVKKNPRIIGSLRDWLTKLTGPVTGRPVDQSLPLLVIDAGYDSYNYLPRRWTSTPSASETSVYELVSAFEKAALVAYPTTAYEPALFRRFPDTFAYHLAPPVRPPRDLAGLFRHYDEEARQETTGPTSILRLVSDNESWLPSRHDQSAAPGAELPASLREAINAFLLACAVHRARGRFSPRNSMSVSVSRFINVQTLVRDQVAAHLGFVATALRDHRAHGAALPTADLRELWRSAVEWAGTSRTEVAEHLAAEAARVRVVTLNSASPNRLGRLAGAPGVVVVGGTKLAQGGGLDGLTISYNLLPHDVGEALDRRFLLRDPALFRHYTTAEVMDSHSGLLTTATERPPRTARSISPEPPTESPVEDLAGFAPETVRFSLSPEVLEQNFQTLENFVRSLDALGSRQTVDPANRSVLWREVPYELIVSRLLDDYLPAPGNTPMLPERVAAYIRQCAAQGSLRTWAVQLIGIETSTPEHDIAGHRLGLVRRSPTDLPVGDSYTVRRLTNPRHEVRDLDQEQYDTALKMTLAARANRGGIAGPRAIEIPSGHAIRSVRRHDQPLLTIYPLLSPLHDTEGPGVPVVGLAVSFPFANRTDE